MDLMRYKFDNWIYAYDLETTGMYGIPVIQPERVEVADYMWTDFRNVGLWRKPGEESKKWGIHFFIQDYRFGCVYNRLNTYTDSLRRVGVVCSPDFSMYTDYPDALSIYSHYRKHVVAAFWQRNGLKVIPSICWTDRHSHAWCFDGEPVGGTVAIANTVLPSNKEAYKNFKYGFDAMMERLEPYQILWYGRRRSDCEGPIVGIPSFCDQRWRKRTSDLTQVQYFDLQEYRKKQEEQKTQEDDT